MSDQTVELLRSIAERLGVEAARVWPQVVMVTWVQSVFWLIADPILVISCVVVGWRTTSWDVRRHTEARAAYITAKQTEHYHYVSSMDYDTLGTLLIAICAVAACFIVGMSALAFFPSALTGALYPEAQTVLRLAGK